MMIAPTQCVSHWEAEFKNGMWWQLPDDVSEQLTLARARGEPVVAFVYEWGIDRPNNYRRPDGSHSTLSRYVIDLDTMMQKNSESGSTRTIRQFWTRDR